MNKYTSIVLRNVQQELHTLAPEKDVAFAWLDTLSREQLKLCLAALTNQERQQLRDWKYQPFFDDTY